MNDNKSKSVINVFNKIAKEYVDYFGCDWEFINEIEQFISYFKENSTILDLGCGSGYITYPGVTSSTTKTGYCDFQCQASQTCDILTETSDLDYMYFHS